MYASVVHNCFIDLHLFMFLGCEYSSPRAVYKGSNSKNIKLIQRLPTGTSSPRKTEDL